MTANKKKPRRSSQHQIMFRLTNIENKIFTEKLNLTNLTKHEYLTRLILYDFAWYTKNESDFINTLNDTSYQISMICRNLKMIVRALEDEFWNDEDIDKVKEGIKEIEKNHINYVSKIRIDTL
ncbi:MAG: hypothetical protein Q4D26_11010 [Clostridia bacterium]|nr:hypothetical protein [Clostridia bacterium]